VDKPRWPRLITTRRRQYTAWLTATMAKQVPQLETVWTIPLQVEAMTLLSPPSHCKTVG